MKRLVNGQEAELLTQVEGVEVSRLADRLVVRTPNGTATAVAVRKGDLTLVSYRGQVYEISKLGAKRHSGGAVQTGEAHAPMPGLIVDVLVQEGDRVEAGDKLLVLEAMKTQQPTTAPFDGTVVKVPVKKGDQVTEGQLLVKVEP
ncbi:MAG: biotin/lipoyl-binding protein [Fimbriimonadaceae bacterium]|nr:biotin/lipoyl-binding protein [Fimbriimonadaceae bacterium]